MNTFLEMYKTVSNNPGYSFGISMFGPWHFNYESVTSTDGKTYENRRGWHTSDGMTFLYTANDLTQYGDDYWPTVNHYRLAGTTVNSNTDQDPNLYNLDSWVNSTVSYDFHYGVTGMYLNASDSKTLQAKKSWIMFQGQVVALGAGVTSNDNVSVETIVENRKLNANGDNSLYVNDQPQPTNLGWGQTLSNVRSMVLQGNGGGSDIGYYFPSPATINASRSARTGSWNDDASLGDSKPKTKNYLELWFDHGVNPVNSTYAYVILPNKDAPAVANYVASNPIWVLRNDIWVQAAFDPATNSLGANFWSDGGTHPVDLAGTPSYIKTDKKASLFLKNTLISGHWYTEIGISDPTRSYAAITVTTAIPANFIAWKGAEFTNVSTLPTTAFKFTVNCGSDGATHFIRFRQN